MDVGQAAFRQISDILRHVTLTHSRVDYRPLEIVLLGWYLAPYGSPDIHVLLAGKISRNDNCGAGIASRVVMYNLSMPTTDSYPSRCFSFLFLHIPARDIETLLQESTSPRFSAIANLIGSPASFIQKRRSNDVMPISECVVKGWITWFVVVT